MGKVEGNIANRSSRAFLEALYRLWFKPRKGRPPARAPGALGSDLDLDRRHAELLGNFEIAPDVIEEHALAERNAEPVGGKGVNGGLGLAQADLARLDNDVNSAKSGAMRSSWSSPLTQLLVSAATLRPPSRNLQRITISGRTSERADIPDHAGASRTRTRLPRISPSNERQNPRGDFAALYALPRPFGPSCITAHHPSDRGSRATHCHVRNRR